MDHIQKTGLETQNDRRPGVAQTRASASAAAFYSADTHRANTVDVFRCGSGELTPCSRRCAPPSEGRLCPLSPSSNVESSQAVFAKTHLYRFANVLPSPSSSRCVVSFEQRQCPHPLCFLAELFWRLSLLRAHHDLAESSIISLPHARPRSVLIMHTTRWSSGMLRLSIENDTCCCSSVVPFRCRS